MSLDQLARQDAQAAVRRALCVDASCSSIEIRCEILRSWVWGLASPPSTVHISRLLGAALPTWQLLSAQRDASAESLRAELRTALSALEDAGDLVDLGGGYWASASCRFVRIPNAGFLLIGGVPTGALPLGAVEHYGPHRHLEQVPPVLAAIAPVEDFKSWARIPGGALQDWAKELGDSLEKQTYTPTSAEPFEFYRPEEARSGAPQFKRWYEDAGQTNGARLARRARLYGAKEYRLVEIRGGQIASSCDLVGIDVRRLMYALDLAAGKPVRALYRRSSERVEWILNSEIPRAEQRVLATIGTLVIPDDRLYQRRWSVVRNEGLARELLVSLGLEIRSAAEEDR